ncbi:MAG TPA: phosphatidate cytidylyltransferase [Verrucomicrobiae bacterium]|nr:phosphatidate cytidylyltransferase [Verrucomicrobiae bacterium]
MAEHIQLKPGDPKSQLAKRLVSSAFFVTISVSTIFLAPMWLFALVVEALVLLSMNEFFSLTQRKQVDVSRPLLFLFAFLLPLAAFNKTGPFVLVLACLFIFMMNFRRPMLSQALISSAVSLFGLVYIAWFLAHLIEMRLLPYGARWTFYVPLIVKGGDAAAYFTGTRFGKAKLLEHVSPNKSVEGAIGGFIASVILSLCSKAFLPHVGLGHLLLLGMLTGSICQIGDLAESLIKRDAGVKDSGQIPGLGGVLDVLDSLLLTIPFVYYYVVIFIGA